MSDSSPINSNDTAFDGMDESMKMEPLTSIQKRPENGMSANSVLCLAYDLHSQQILMKLSNFGFFLLFIRFSNIAYG